MVGVDVHEQLSQLLVQPVVLQLTLHGHLVVHASHLHRVIDEDAGDDVERRENGHQDVQDGKHDKDKPDAFQQSHHLPPAHAAQNRHEQRQHRHGEVVEKHQQVINFGGRRRHVRHVLCRTVQKDHAEEKDDDDKDDACPQGGGSCGTSAWAPQHAEHTDVAEIKN